LGISNKNSPFLINPREIKPRQKFLPATPLRSHLPATASNKHRRLVDTLLATATPWSARITGWPTRLTSGELAYLHRPCLTGRHGDLLVCGKLKKCGVFSHKIAAVYFTASFNLNGPVGTAPPAETVAAAIAGEPAPQRIMCMSLL